MLGDAFLRGLVDHGAHVGRDVPRVAHDQRVHRAFQHLDHIFGDVFLDIETAQGRTALPGRLERAFDNRLHGLFGQGGAVDDHGVQPPRFRDQDRTGVTMFSHRGPDAQRCGGRSGEGHAVDPFVRGQRRADLATAGQQLQGVTGHPRIMQQGHGKEGDQRGLFRRLGQHRIARSQCRADLPAENRQREVPRRDAGENASGGRVGRLLCVVAQEIHRLAQFCHAVGQAFAGLARQQGENLAVVRFQHIGCAQQDLAAFL